MGGLHHCIQLCTGSALEKPSDDGMMSTQLYLAVCAGKIDKETMALFPADHDQVAGIVSAEGNNVLHLAAQQGHDSLIRELYVSSGNNDKSLLSSRNSAQDTPLHCGARAGHENVVTVLVELARDSGDDSSLRCKNEAGDTALHLSASLGHAAAVEAMVNQAPDLVSQVNNAGVSPLYLAVMSRSLPAVRAITISRGQALASAAGPSSQNALHAAVFQGKRMVSLLLDWKSSLASEADGSGSTPLHFASSDGDSSVVRAILRAVPPSAVRTRDNSRLSALHIAAGMGHEGVTRALMKKCPDAAELRDDRGGTFLHAAARGGHFEVISLATKKPTLLLRHSNFSRGLLNMQDGDGNTALHLAVAARAPTVAEDLLRNGKVRADVMNNDGHTPLDLAARSTSFSSMLGLVLTLAAFGGQSRPQRRDHVEKWNGHDIAKSMEKTSDSLAVVAVLIATVAFTATNNVPGAYEQADDANKKVFKGMAVLQHEHLFECFLVLDSFALVTSVIAVVLLVFGKASRSAGSWKSFAVALHCLWASLLGMSVGFYAALSAVTTTRAVSVIAYTIIYSGFTMLYYTVYDLIAPPVSLCTVLKVIWRTFFLRGRNNVFRRRMRQQHPVASAYALNLFVFKMIANLALGGTVVISVLSEIARSKKQ